MKVSWLWLTWILVVLAAPAFAQGPTLKSVTFPASPDHNLTLSDGTVVLTRYELVLVKSGGTTPAGYRRSRQADAGCDDQTDRVDERAAPGRVALGGLRRTLGGRRAGRAINRRSVAPFSQGRSPGCPDGTRDHPAVILIGDQRIALTVCW
jgi:hypothetical protein